MGSLQNYTTAELRLALMKHQEGRVILPAKMRKEIEQQIKHRAARESN